MGWRGRCEQLAFAAHCQAVPAALLGSAQVDRLAAELLAAHGCIDILVNVAGACELALLLSGF